MNLHEHEVWVAMSESIVLQGRLMVPDGARAVIVFGQAAADGRFDEHSRGLAEVLCGSGLATLMVDLLTDDEDADRRMRMEVDLLARRMVATSRWLPQLQLTRGLGIGYLATGTAAAAALVAAGREPHRIGAVVTRAARLDLLDEEQLASVWAPTLLLAPRHDANSLHIHRDAIRHMATEKQLELITLGDGPLDHAGGVEYQGRLAREWFVRHLAVVEQPWNSSVAG